MSRHLLIDGGQTGCRIVCTEDGKEIGSGNGAGLSRQAGDRVQGLLEVLGQAFQDIDLGVRLGATDVVAAGLTGFDGSPDTARTIAGSIRSLVEAERVIVTNDAVTSYLGAIGINPGAMVAAGTGIIALAGDTDGTFARADGWGFILGDEGSGYYVGRRGLASALRAWDGRGGSEVLRQKAEESIGKPEEIKQHVYGASNPASEVADFALQVAEAAREGDHTASEIWEDAAKEAAVTTTAALGQVFRPGTSVTISWTGSLFDAEDLMLEPFKQHVAEGWPSARLLAPEGTALHGAALLARSGEFPMFGSLLHVF